MSDTERVPLYGNAGDAAELSRGDRDRTLEAMHALELAVGSAGSGGERAWSAAVADALERLQAALDEQAGTYDDPTSLMAQVAADDPQLRTLVRQLHARWADLARAVTTLRHQQATAGRVTSWTLEDIREQTRWLMAALHHHRAREADLVFRALDIDLTSS